MRIVSTVLPLALALGLALADVASTPVLDELVPRDIEPRSIWDDIWNDIKSATTCAGCQGVLTVLKGAAALGDSFFVTVVTEVCKLSGVSALSSESIKLHLRLQKGKD